MRKSSLLYTTDSNLNNLFDEEKRKRRVEKIIIVRVKHKRERRINMKVLKNYFQT